MELLVLGGTRLIGVHLVEELLRMGHQVTIATRGLTEDPFGDRVERLTVERTNSEDLKSKLKGRHFDLVCDSLAYCSLDVKALLEAVSCRHYTMISSASVYDVTLNLKEEDFDPYTYPLKWCHREEYPYDEIKRQAECALFQHYQDRSAAAVRYPYVIGRDDYTKRLYFYADHIVKGKPMHIDNLEEELSFISSEEAGRFLAWVAVSELTGTFNASGLGTISLGEIIRYVEEKSGRKALLTESGEEAPYNGAPSFSLNVNRAEAAGYSFRPINEYIYELLDYYMDEASTG
jgi:nucleoside-diphosphate-sugar epimerase